METIFTFDYYVFLKLW